MTSCVAVARGTATGAATLVRLMSEEDFVTRPPSVPVREYRDTDERRWLHCRLVSFFDTDYFDDVHTERDRFELPALRLVADDGGPIMGLLDVEIDGSAATIDCVAVHPDHRRRGIATALLETALGRLPAGVRTLDAWTREDDPAISWYRRNGFSERTRYLHVYKHWSEPVTGFAVPAGLSGPVIAFCHGRIEDEEAMRARFRRVYVCRQMLRELG